MTMKKLFIIVVLSAISYTTYAQDKDITKFMGILIDGTKVEMINKLKEKGFKSTAHYKDMLEGEFNGQNVYISVMTYKDKVYRIAVNYMTTKNEADLRITYNNLCDQFLDNPKYIPILTEPEEYLIPKDEDISYEIKVNNKRYDAIFYQYDENQIQKMMQEFIENKYSAETIEKLGDDDQKKVILEASLEIYEKVKKNCVWFTISENLGKYSITLYYDNMYNHANGEDL